MNKFPDFAKKYPTAAGAVTGAAAVLTYFSLDDSRPKATFYKMASKRVRAPFRIGLISDLHSYELGKGQWKLLHMTRTLKPDILAFCGDIFDDLRMCDDAVMELLDPLGKEFRGFYVTGNHECWSGRIDPILRKIRSCGITVLNGEGMDIEINGTPVSIWGIDDPAIDMCRGNGTFALELNRYSTEAGRFSVLLSHRPEYADIFSSLPCDLVLAGHAHGGQWRSPLFPNGLFASGQGFFPEYTGGEYPLGEGRMLIVSTGLRPGTRPLPRINNRPEIVFVDVVPCSA
ncbi:MAG: metallophosphoesterase [Oscillospiraceae bacterium]|jgi:predicted MPP superfamily phosphohydrolase